MVRILAIVLLGLLGLAVVVAIGGMFLGGAAREAFGWLLVAMVVIVPSMAIPIALAVAVAPKKAVEKYRLVRSVAGLALIGLAFSAPFIQIAANKPHQPKDSVARLKSACELKAKEEIFTTVPNVEAFDIEPPDSASHRAVGRAHLVDLPATEFDLWSKTWTQREDNQPRYQTVREISPRFDAHGSKRPNVTAYALRDTKNPYRSQPTTDTAQPARYVLTWDIVQTTDESIAWLYGIESRVVDTETEQVLARRVTYYQWSGKPNVYREVVNVAAGCDNAIKARTAEEIQLHRDSYHWVSKVLLPTS